MLRSLNCVDGGEKMNLRSCSGLRGPLSIGVQHEVLEAVAANAEKGCVVPPEGVPIESVENDLKAEDVVVDSSLCGWRRAP